MERAMVSMEKPNWIPDTTSSSINDLTPFTPILPGTSNRTPGTLASRRRRYQLRVRRGVCGEIHTGYDGDDGRVARYARVNVAHGTHRKCSERGRELIAEVTVVGRDLRDGQTEQRCHHHDPPLPEYGTTAQHQASS